MQYNLGKYLKDRYMETNPLLNSSYSRYEIYVRSTDINRTLMSAQSNLAGLYPPVESPFQLDTLTWQPIPVHTEPVPGDYVSLRCLFPHNM